MENSGRLLAEEDEKFSALKILEAIIAAKNSKTNSSSVRDYVIIHESNKRLFFATLKR